jgi:predicted Zn finger-like uncharacterized protein
VNVNCTNCGTVSLLVDQKIPVGRSYVVCPSCKVRINIFKGLGIGSVITNLVNLRFLASSGELEERFAEAGETWRVVNVIEPCPDKGKGRACELTNKGRCPNQRLVVRLSRDTTLYKTCLYRGGRRIFDKGGRAPVGSCALTSGSMSVEPRRGRNQQRSKVEADGTLALK